MKTTKPKSKPRTPNKPKPKAKASPIKSEVRLFDANCTAQQIFDALTGKSK
jgi:hypothetical protein